MITLSWLTATFGALSILLSADGVLANPRLRQGVSPYFINSDSCPERCSISGPNTGNWSAYPDFKQLKRCQQTMFYDFSIYDNVDNLDTTHRIHACSSYGPDFFMLPEAKSTISSAQSVDVNFEVGWWDASYGLAASGIRSLVKQMRKYVDRGYGATDRAFIMFGRSGQASIGLYIGKGLQNQGLTAAMKIFQDNVENLNGETPSLAMQLCEPGYDSTHIFGMIVTSNGSFSAIQDAIKSWSNATCLSFSGSANFTGKAMLTTPFVPTNDTTPLVPRNGTTLLIPINGTASQKRHIAHHARHNAHHAQQIEPHARHSDLEVRAECKTVQVESGDICDTLAAKCGIPYAAFLKVNSADKFCDLLKPKQHVCCSMGTLPDFSPKPNADGSCHAYEVVADDNCDNLAAEYSLTKPDLEDFNKNTWGWNGCQLLYIGTRMCLSKGTPPFPSTIANAVCGPQKPDTKAPTDDSDISKLNPCPLNACCNIWGQCGITRDFCVDTNTGAPGTAEEGTFGCISNCGTDVVKGSGSGNIRIGYYEGYGMGRECLFQDASQIDVSKYTHVHFAFGTLTPEFEVEVGDVISTYNFKVFKRLPKVKRILSFGGWAFSNEDATYMIFRNGVTAANRLKMATKIADFIKKHDLDGVDIDWEYPGAPDLPDIARAATKADGPNYLAFLVILKNLLPGKSVSIAAPSSYWYLKQFPIKDIGKVVDYIVYMTYDLHGQWDTGSAYAQEGCDNGNCLRSHVNLTETKQSLAMITKAGVPGNKVIVGVTSYGRSFNMAEAGCWGPTCQYSGDRLNSHATPGKCTGTSGYIADAEIAEIMKGTKRDARVVTSFVDKSSNSDVLVYDNNQYVSYMSDATKKVRQVLYANLGLGGTSDWATDLQMYNDAPNESGSWPEYIQDIKNGLDPMKDNNRTGNWTSLDCMNELIRLPQYHEAQDRWKGLYAADAWKDVLRIWLKTDSKLTWADGSPRLAFSESVAITLTEAEGIHCEKMEDSSCDVTRPCENGMNGEFSGPAGMLIWNSLVAIHQLFQAWHENVKSVMGTVNPQLGHFEDTFAPVPAAPENRWTYFFIDLLTLGTLSIAAPIFNGVVKDLAFFKGTAGDNVKDTTMTLIGQSTTIAKDLIKPPGDRWTGDAQEKFSSYMGTVFKQWLAVSEQALKKIFNGKEDSLAVLSSAITNGKLISNDGQLASNDSTVARGYVEKTFFGFSIPLLWQVSDTRAFILDSGVSCSGSASLDEYMSTATADATGMCIGTSLYYLVYPEGESRSCKTGKCHGDKETGRFCDEDCENSKFSIPPGLDSLNGQNWGGITMKDLIRGSYNTWDKNSRKNKPLIDSFADLSNEDTKMRLMNNDITTAGIIRLPVCSPDVAWQTWDRTTNISAVENYPCGVLTPPEGKKTCGEYEYENDWSEASPFIQDCLQILRNIEWDATTMWEAKTSVVDKIASYGSCAFSVEVADGAKGVNVNYRVGGQDLQNIINHVVKEFERDGKIGAFGKMNCGGNSVKQPVRWALH